MQGLAEGDLAAFQALLRMNEGIFEGIRPRRGDVRLVRLWALATLYAAPTSWLLNIKLSGDAGVAPESILGTLIAIAPVIGTARVVSAAGHIKQALELAEAIAEGNQ